jgi:TP901 family phage tail tape measure protein
VVSESADEMSKSAKRAGAVAAAAAKEMGASVDAQVAASGRAAAAFVESQDAMSRAQKAAAVAAADAAKSAGQSADAQVAAATRAADAQKKAADAQVAATKAHATVSKAGGIIALGLVGAGVAAVKLGEQFQTAQATIQGATGQSAKSVGQLTSAFTALGSGTHAAVGSGQQMEAAYGQVAGQLKLTEGHVLSAAEATKFSSAANNLAEGTGIDLASAYSATAKVMQTFHMSASQAAQVTDALYSTSKALNVPVEQIAAAMGKLHARLGEVAPSMGDVSGLMVALGEHGLTGGRGVMVVNTAFQTLLGGSKKTDEVLKALGVSVYDSSGKFIGMQNVIAQLQPRLAGLSEHQRRYAESALFGKGATEVLGQVVQAGVPAFQHATDAATRHGAALRAAEAQSKTFHNEMEALKHTVETLGGSLGQVLIPDLQKVAHALSEGIQWLEKHKAAAIALGTVITGVLGTAVAIFAYDQSVKFVQGTKRMIDGLSSLVSSSSSAAAQVEADQAAQSGSFRSTATAAGVAEGEVATATAGGATAVGTADSAIEISNATAGASFKALARGAIKYLSMIGAAYVAAEVSAKAFGSALSAITGEHQPENLSELVGGTQPGEKGIAEADKRAGRGSGQLGKSNQYGFVAEIAKRYGVSPNTLWGIYGTETSYGANITTSSTGAKGAFQFEPGTAKTYGYPLTNHPDAKQFQAQAEAAARYIATNTHKYHSEAKAIEAYYAGHPGGQGDYLHAGEAAGGSHYGKAQEEELKAASPGSNPALQRQMEEASGARPKKAKAEPYVNPFGQLQGYQFRKIDQGVDVGGHGALDTLGAGKIFKVTTRDPRWEGGSFIGEELTQGKYKGQDVYYAMEGQAGGVGVRQGQTVRAGQQIGTLEKGGEFGFAYGHGTNLPAQEFAPGNAPGNGPTPAGREFNKFLESIGKSGSVLSLASKAAEAAEKAETKRLTKLKESAKKMLGETTPRGSLESAIQSGSVSQLERVLGVSTAGRADVAIHAALGRTEGGQLSQARLEHAVMPALARSAAGTPTGREFASLVSQLRASGMTSLARDVVQAHKQALADLGRELYAVAQEQQAQALQNQVTKEKDLTAQTANHAAKQLQTAKDSSTQTTDAMGAAARGIDDATQIMKDRFAEMAEAVSLATQKMSDVASGEVQKTQDQTAIKVTELGERGKYGLDLVAQKLEVQLDQMKAAYDIQIQQAKMAVDQAKISGQQLTAEKQQGIDLLQTQ